MTTLLQIERLLKDAIGLHAESIGVSAVVRAVQERQRASRSADADQYLALVRASPAELQQLIDAVVVPETWFFRDRGAFAALVGYVFNDWLPASGRAGLRVLSAPCSTGEEPYSIAMALLDAGLEPHRFRIDAIDVCERSLAIAREGVFRRASFRGHAPFRQRHFVPLEGAHQVSATVRQCVDFRHANLFAIGHGGAEADPPYDVIFCRNLLIYFDEPTQQRAVRLLESRLSSDGLLFVGPSETAAFTGHAFVPLREPMAFALRKATTPAQPSPAAGVPAVRRPRVNRTPAVRPFTAPPVHAPQPSMPGPAEALKLADQGRLNEALDCCEAHLRCCGPSSDVFHVIGLVQDALGNATEAASAYRKALYLDPKHDQAAVQLALLMEKAGQLTEAEALWNRARRIAASVHR